MTIVTTIVVVLVVLGILYRKKKSQTKEMKKAPIHQCRYKLQIQKVIQ